MIASSLVFLSFLATPGALAGQVVVDSVITDQESRLAELTEQLRVATSEQTNLTAEVETLRADRSELNRRLIETAERIQAGERQITIAEERLARLTENEILLRGSLKTRRFELAELLAALQRLGISPPPAIAVRPENALAAIRSAILLGTIVPELRGQARRLSSDLSELVALREGIETEKIRLATTTSELETERQRIATLLESRRNSLAASEQDLAAIKERAESLAAQTDNLKDLIARMDEQVATRMQPAPEDPSAPVNDTSGNIQLAMSDPGRIRPAISFGDARGMLPLPVSGVRLQGYGDADRYGGKTQGLAYTTRKEAQVTSPNDGWVVYAGPFRSYGQLLIINAGNGYHILLAGMERINVVPGQFVLAGEPVAVMGGAPTLAQSLLAAESSNQPVLYVEFRKNGSSIDPDPWWVSDSERARG